MKLINTVNIGVIKILWKIMWQQTIDFVVDCYQGEGKYQVINGEYKKIDE